MHTVTRVVGVFVHFRAPLHNETSGKSDRRNSIRQIATIPWGENIKSEIANLIDKLKVPKEEFNYFAYLFVFKIMVKGV
jgi:hypothetical protein